MKYYNFTPAAPDFAMNLFATCIYIYISIPLKLYFKGFYWDISNINHGVYLTYTPSHGVLIHLKGITANIYIKP